MKLVFCLGGNRAYPPLARAAGWWPGARLPSTLYTDQLYFADQDWRKFAGLTPDDSRYQAAYQRYIAAVAAARPFMASVIDWTPDRTLDEVLAWAAAVTPHVERVQIIPKVPGAIEQVPRLFAGRPVVLGFSVPTRHGATPCDAAEFSGWPVHLLGGNPRQQIHYACLLASYGADIVSADGNLIHQAAGRGTFWEHGRARNLGAYRLTTIEALQRSLVEVPRLWRSAGFEVKESS